MRVILVAAATVCGKIGPNVKGSSLDRAHLEQLRLETDAGLMGASTLRDDDPEMRAVGGILPKSRLRAVITTSQTLPFHKKFFSSEPFPVVFSSEASASFLKPQASKGVEVVSVPFFSAKNLSLLHVLRWFEQRGVNSVLIEGGGRLNYAAIAQGIVHEIYLTILPQVEGGAKGAWLIAGDIGLGKRLLLKKCLSLETGEVILHYEVM